MNTLTELEQANRVVMHDTYAEVMKALSPVLAEYGWGTIDVREIAEAAANAARLKAMEILAR